MFQTIDKMKKALSDMKDLYLDVESEMFIPKRFRKIPTERFFKLEKNKYLSYLNVEILDLSKRIKQYEEKR